MKTQFLSIVLLFGLTTQLMTAQSDVSLFMRSDKYQRAVLDTVADDLFKPIGHHGPAIENSYMALRLYYKEGCAIDVYSKTKPCLELKEYAWYTTDEQIDAGAGCDEYLVGKTTGLGGMSLWDGEKQLLLASTAGRRCEVKKTKKGAELSMLLRGVEYKGEKIDIKITIRVSDNSRVAEVEGECTSGQKVIFMSGVNFHQGEKLMVNDGRMAVWGLHPANIVKNPHPLGAGLSYDCDEWKANGITTTDGFISIITKQPVMKAKVTIVAACSREDELNNEAKFFDFVDRM